MKRGPIPKSREGLEPGTLVCLRCKQESPKENFHKDKNRPNGRYPECKKCTAERRASFYEKNKTGLLAVYKKYNLKVRKTVLDHYGHKCACCGETTYEFLAIDHINNDGYAHRREIFGGNSGKGSKSMCVWLIKNNFPPGFQLLCHNCNMAKGFYGACPHQAGDSNEQNLS